MIVLALVTGTFGTSMIMAAYKDLTSYTIPNWISMLMIIGFLALSPFLGLSWAEFGIHIAVFLGSLFIRMVMFSLGWLGGGDAKLFAATAIWWMPPDLLNYLMYTTLAGGVLAIIILAARKLMPLTITKTGWLHRLLRDETKIPYGLALAFAGMITLPMSELYLSLTI